MKLTNIEECPHCSKRLAKALDHWSKCFLDGTVDDDCFSEISEILSNKAEELRNHHSEYAKSLRLKAQQAFDSLCVEKTIAEDKS